MRFFVFWLKALVPIPDGHNEIRNSRSLFSLSTPLNDLVRFWFRSSRPHHRFYPPAVHLTYFLNVLRFPGIMQLRLHDMVSGAKMHAGSLCGSEHEPERTQLMCNFAHMINAALPMDS